MASHQSSVLAVGSLFAPAPGNCWLSNSTNSQSGWVIRKSLTSQAKLPSLSMKRARSSATIYLSIERRFINSELLQAGYLQRLLVDLLCASNNSFIHPFFPFLKQEIISNTRHNSQWSQIDWIKLKLQTCNKKMRDRFMSPLCPLSESHKYDISNAIKLYVCVLLHNSYIYMLLCNSWTKHPNLLPHQLCKC